MSECNSRSQRLSQINPLQFIQRTPKSSSERTASLGQDTDLQGMRTRTCQEGRKRSVERPLPQTGFEVLTNMDPSWAPTAAMREEALLALLHRQ